MKNLIKIICSIILLFGIFLTVNAGVIDLEQAQGIDNIKQQSIKNIDSSGDINDNINKLGFSVLTIIKYVLSAVLVAFIVFAGIQMIMSMGNDEDKLSSSKRQLRYSVIGLIFINIPGTIYNIFNNDGIKTNIDGSIGGTWSSQLSQQEESIFIDTFLFDQTINGGIVMFIETVIFSLAIFMLVLAGIKILTSRGREEQVSEGKNKIIWSIVGLIFIGFIESWQALVYNGQISDGANLFETMEKLALFFAGPVAIFFLTLAGYYYITSNGDEERTKKAKNIIVSVIIATIILLASHTFLKDLLTLSI